jgi:hypothetical protein
MVPEVTPEDAAAVDETAAEPAAVPRETETP